MVAMLGESRAESKAAKLAAMKVVWMANRLAGQLVLSVGMLVVLMAETMAL
jgi:hypothetical protein